MSSRITPDHLGRAAVVYVRQSTMAQVTGNLESQRRQYDLAGAAQATGFRSVTVIDDDLGRSGSGSMARPGFERLVAMVCAGDIGAVYCIEASRLARNGRDWHHLIDLCALVGTLVIDPDGAYDPRLVNDRLLLGLKGTMSEYELSLMRQRGIAARDSKAKRGEYRFMLPPGLCWSEAGKIEIDPDEHVAEAVRLVFAKFRELGSAPAGVPVAARDGHQDAGGPAQRRRLQDRLEASFLPRRHADPPQSALCRCLCLRPAGAAHPRSSTGARARTAGSPSPERNGACCCAITIPATSAGRSTRITRGCCSRTRI